MSGSPTPPASHTDLDSWITAANAPSTWTQDSDPTGTQPAMETYFNTGRETYYLIDLSTMKIAAIDHDEASALTSLRSHLP